MDKYIHVVQYYETDKMGISHHSNYVRWMEEARMIFLKKEGCDFQELEKRGITSPVISIEGKYMHKTTFEDKINIEVVVSKLTHATFSFNYIFKNEDNVVVFKGKSEHCFVNRDGFPVRLSKELPELYNNLKRSISEEG